MALPERFYDHALPVCQFMDHFIQFHRRNGGGQRAIGCNAPRYSQPLHKLRYNACTLMMFCTPYPLPVQRSCMHSFNPKLYITNQNRKASSHANDFDQTKIRPLISLTFRKPRPHHRCVDDTTLAARPRTRAVQDRGADVQSSARQRATISATSCRRR